jgi:putative DNA-invertase from lambdoid prophage Rac
MKNASSSTLWKPYYTTGMVEAWQGTRSVGESPGDLVVERHRSTVTGTPRVLPEPPCAETAAVYLRVSTDMQTTDCQEPECIQLVEQHRWKLVKVYREQESAVKRRPVFASAMADARAGIFKHLVVWRLDRFGRLMQGNINDVLELDRVGVDVVSVKEPWLAAGGPARNLLLAIFSWLAEEERRVLVERVKAGMALARKRGVIFGKPQPSAEQIGVAAAEVFSGVSIRDAARHQGIGYVPVRQHLALSAAACVRKGENVRAASRRHGLVVDTIRRVLAGTSYLNRYPNRAWSNAPAIRCTYLPFERARDLARSLRLGTKAEWIAWCGGRSYELEVPMRPHEFYPGEWKGWSDWLGYRTRLPFEEARAFARGLHFTSQQEWRGWCRAGKRPRWIPYDPKQAYPSEYKGGPDWLGYPPWNFRGRMMSFQDARDRVRSLELTSAKEYFAWSKTPARDRTIAANPPRTYAAEWAGWQDYLGYPSRKLLPFLKARATVRTIGLRSRKEWNAWARSGLRPPNIPAHPDHSYAIYWRGMADWLGYQRVIMLPFLRARAFVRRLELRSCSAWQAWAKTPERPRNVPSDPSKAYRSSWLGWRDWLGKT